LLFLAYKFISFLISNFHTFYDALAKKAELTAAQPPKVGLGTTTNSIYHYYAQAARMMQ